MFGAGIRRTTCGEESRPRLKEKGNQDQPRRLSRCIKALTIVSLWRCVLFVGTRAPYGFCVNTEITHV